MVSKYLHISLNATRLTVVLRAERQLVFFPVLKGCQRCLNISVRTLHVYNMNRARGATFDTDFLLFPFATADDAKRHLRRRNDQISFDAAENRDLDKRPLFTCRRYLDFIVQTS